MLSNVAVAAADVVDFSVVSVITIAKSTGTSITINADTIAVIATATFFVTAACIKAVIAIVAIVVAFSR